MKQIIIEHAANLLNIDSNIIETYKNEKYCDIENIEIREKVHIFNNYYDFIYYEECVSHIEKIYSVLSSNIDIKIKDKDKLALSIILYKSFLEKKILIENNEKYINSDDIFNYTFDNFFKYLLLEKSYIRERSIQTLILHALDLLVENNLINAKTIRIKDNTYKSYKYYNIPISTYYKHINHLFNFSFVEYRWIEIDEKYFISTFHYSKTFEVNKKNFYSNKSFKIKNKNYILKKINLKLYVDNDYQNDIKDKYKNEIGVLLVNLNKYYETINLLFDNDFWSSKTKIELITVQKKIAKITEELIIIAFANYEFKDMHIIFPLIIDFRGRKYYYSSANPTNSKILRLSYYYGYYSNQEIENNTIKYSLTHIDKIKKFCESYNINNETKFIEAIFWCLIGIGKFFIDKNKYPISTEEFINAGISHFNVTLNVKIEIELEINHYIRIIKSFWDKKIKKRIIIKDATASINQIFMKKLGPINQNSLNYVNLGNENLWYDTYLVHRDKYYRYIIDNKLHENFQNRAIFNSYLERKLIKNTIMTIPYSAGFDLCWKNYIDKIIENKLDIIINQNLKKMYKDFYKFIKTDMQNIYLYLKNTHLLVQKINEDFEELRKYILESETGEANISYYKMKKSSIDKKYKINNQNRRITKLILVPTKALDIEAFNVASGANTAHFLDADEIRSIEIELGYSIITIHDSYLIDIFNCTNLIDTKIKHYQKHLNKFKISNIFILL